MTALSDHLASGASSVCRAWVVTRTDGVVLGFTDHDRDLIVDGVQCTASTGLSAGALQATSGLAVDNSEAQGALSHDAITEADIRAGRWDAAEVVSYLVNWADPAAFEIVFRGTLGEISWGEGAFSAELRGLSEALNVTRGRVFQGRCDAVLGDTRCKVEMGPLFAVEAEVRSVSEGRLFVFDALREYAPKWFERGRLIVISGEAAGLEERIKTDRGNDTQRTVELWSMLRAPIVPGDRIRLEAGCDKRAETCRLKFNNILNFRGFPSIPGEDWLMAYPTRDGRNDGGSL